MGTLAMSTITVDRSIYDSIFLNRVATLVALGLDLRAAREQTADEMRDLQIFDDVVRVEMKKDKEENGIYG
jgi:hypothetical protein